MAVFTLFHNGCLWPKKIERFDWQNFAGLRCGKLSRIYVIAANRPSFASSMNSSGYGYASSNMNPFVYGHQNSRAAQPFPVSHPFSHQPSGVHVNNLLARQPRHTDAAHEDFVRNGVTFSSRTYYDLDGNALARKGTHPDLIAAREKYGRSTSISLSPLMGQLDIPTQRKLPSDASIKCAVPAQQAPNGEPQKANKTAKGTCKMVRSWSNVAFSGLAFYRIFC